jgi:hypothetical protein
MNENRQSHIFQINNRRVTLIVTDHGNHTHAVLERDRPLAPADLPAFNSWFNPIAEPWFKTDSFFETPRGCAWIVKEGESFKMLLVGITLDVYLTE